MGKPDHPDFPCWRLCKSLRSVSRRQSISFCLPAQQDFSFPHRGFLHQSPSQSPPPLHAAMGSEPWSASWKATGLLQQIISVTRQHIFALQLKRTPRFTSPESRPTGNTAQRRTLSQLNPTTGAYYSTITLMDDGVNTSYNALKLTAQHRFSHNYTVLVSYTYSHCLAGY